MTRLPLLFLILTTLLCSAALAQPPQVGDTLPAFTMAPPALEKDARTLGLPVNHPFTLADLGTPYALIEIIGVYCSVCHQQAPDLTRLYKRLKKTRLDKRITLFGIAAGATPMEVEFIRKKEYPFPIIHDTKFEIYAALAEPKTPFTLIVDRQGKVLYTHLGIIPDFNDFFKTIQEMVQ